MKQIQISKGKTPAALQKLFDFNWEDPLAFLSAVGQDLMKLDSKDARANAVKYSFDIMQAALRNDVKKKLLYDIQAKIQQGKMPQDFLKNDWSRKSFMDIVEIIDSENPSQDKIDAMKALLVAISNAEEKEQYVIATYLNTLKQLDSVEFQILMASYRIRKKGRTDQRSPATPGAWMEYVMDELQWDEIMIYEVDRRETHLNDLRIIDGRIGSDGSRLAHTKNCRLTGLGVKIGDLVTAQD